MSTNPHAYPGRSEFDLLLDDLESEMREREGRARVAEHEAMLNKALSSISAGQQQVRRHIAAWEAEAAAWAAERQRLEDAKALARRTLPKMLAKALTLQKEGQITAHDVIRLEATVANFAMSHGL